MIAVEDPVQLKEDIRTYWNRQSCDTQFSRSEKFSKAYFEEIERIRYFDQAFIHAFAQFTRYHGKKVLEVGYGAGTDFIQWLRAGAKVSGIDLTQEAFNNVSRRIEAYGLPRPEDLRVGDAENLPFESNSFDLGYSFGVLHASPDTPKAIGELVRVVKPGGEVKIMVYNRYCIWLINRWIKFALLQGKPWKSLDWVMWYHNESIGMKCYTRRELLALLAPFPLEQIQIQTEITSGDYLSSSAFPPLQWFHRFLIRMAGTHFGWHPNYYLPRVDAEEPDLKSAEVRYERDPKKPLLTGNPLGYFHCIRAVKTGTP
jgi:SAM-dependent methyltransferase